MKKLIVPAILLVLAVLAYISYSQSVSPVPYVTPWSNRSYRANKADSVKAQDGTYKPVWLILAGDTALLAGKADSVKWGASYHLLSAILPDSFALFLRLHALADSAADSKLIQGKDTTWIKSLTPASVGNSDSLQHAYPDFGVNLLAESLAVKAPLASPTFTGLVTEDSLSTKKIIATTTAGDSVLIYTAADRPIIRFSVNGARDSLYWNSNRLQWTDMFSIGNNTLYCGNVDGQGAYSLNFQNLYTNTANGAVKVYGAVGSAKMVAIASSDTNGGLVVDTNKTILKSRATGLGKNNCWQWNYSKDAPAMLVSDSTASGARTTDSLYYDGGALWGTMPFKLPYIAVAKDTTLEIALFTRTCTRDTLTYMTGADSLTAAYIVSPFGTRGAITCPPYVAGVVDGKLVIDRPAADTASYDRYSVTRIIQR